MEVDLAESDNGPIRKGADSRQCLALSDAIPVQASADLNRQVNAGWLPTNSLGVPMRPVPLLTIGGQVPQARIAHPSPRYGSNVAEWGPMPLVAPMEREAVPSTDEQHVPVESPSSLVDAMFAPPTISPVPSLPDGQADRGAVVSMDTSPANSGENYSQLVGDQGEALAEPLPPLDPSLTDSFELPLLEVHEDVFPPILEASDAVLVCLPPVQATEPQWVTLPPVASITESADLASELQELGLVLLPPVDRNLSGAIEMPAMARIGGPFERSADDVAPVLIPLPPVDPRVFVPAIPHAITMFEGLLKPIDSEPDADSPLQIGDETTVDGEALQPSGGATEEDRSAAVTVSEDVLQPLPPVEEGEGGRDGLEAAGATAVEGESFDPKAYERTWDLELTTQEADKHTRRGFELANKSAYFSARLEYTRALRITAQGLDTERRTHRYSQSLAAGLRALAEAEDFLPKNGHLEAELDLTVLAEAHRTPLLRECEADDMTPLAAIQEYHAYAQEQMAAAVGKEMAGSMALSGLGKLHIVMAEQQRGHGIALARPKAMALLQAALLASPANHMASNELGVLLARNGRHEEARVAFRHSIAAHPTAEGWRNLALACERLGEMDEAYGAAQQTLALRSKSIDKTSSVTVSSHGSIRWVPPAAMANRGGGARTASAATRNAR